MMTFSTAADDDDSDMATTTPDDAATFNLMKTGKSSHAAREYVLLWMNANVE
jgi:hypothetical protein